MQEPVAQWPCLVSTGLLNLILQLNSLNAVFFSRQLLGLEFFHCTKKESFQNRNPQGVLVPRYISRSSLAWGHCGILFLSPFPILSLSQFSTNKYRIGTQKALCNNRRWLIVKGLRITPACDLQKQKRE